ncbi:MAG: peptidylprolyl isomerase [Planctomycetota bacterium]
MSTTSFRRAAAVAATSAAVCFSAGCSTPSNRPVESDARPLQAAPPVATPEAPPSATANPPADPPPASSADERPSTRTAAADPVFAPPPNGVADEIDDRAVSWPRAVDGPGDVVIARVAGRDVPITELVSKWILRRPDEVRALLDDLVLSRIVVLEAGALGLQPPADEVDATVRSQLQQLERRARAAGAPDMQTYVRKTLGFEPDVFLKNLEAEAAIDRLAPRCVRSWLLASDHRIVRAIIVDGQGAVDEVQARLANDESFANIASDLSKDASREQGGRVPPLVRGDSTLARTAFAAEVGEVAGPVREGDSYLFVLVEEAPDRVDGIWADIGDRVEASLEEREIEDPEFWQWKEAMARRYDVDIGPFLELLR